MSIFTRFYLGIFFFGFLQASYAGVNVQVGQWLESTAGRLLMSSPRGKLLSSTVVHGAQSGEVSADVLLRHLASPENLAIEEELAKGFEHVQNQFVKKYADRSDLFTSGNHPELSADEAQYLNRLFEQEFNRRMLKRFPNQGLANEQVVDTLETARTRLETIAASREAPKVAFAELNAATKNTFAVGASQFTSIKTLMEAQPELGRFFDIDVIRNSLLVESEVYAAEGLDRFVKTFQTLAERPGSTFSQNFEEALGESLRGQVPEATRLGRVKSFLKNPQSSVAFRRALGELSFKEVSVMLYGKNRAAPSADSLIGQYIQKTGAQVGERAFMLDRTGKMVNPVGRTAGEVGPSRLIVPISEEGKAVWLELMGKNRNLLAHFHTPGQGTLKLAYRNHYVTYATPYLSSPIQAGSSFNFDVLLPTIVMSDREASSLQRYLSLGIQNGQEARYPWLASIDGTRLYCKRGGYTSCTHWVGDMPVGEKMVREYTFPGNVDQYAGNAVGPEVQTGPLANFNGGVPTVEQSRRQLVWKTPGQMQFFEMMGLHNQQVGGELANPGYVLESLLGHTSADRIPVVFWVTTDARLPLSEEVLLNHAAY